MTELSPEALNSLSREELIALIVQLFAKVRQLRAEVERLKKPPTTSQNSSQPPSRDQKRNLPGGRRHRRRGAKPGHAKAERPWSDHPDQVIKARVTHCADCGADLQTVPPQAVVRRQVTELPVVQPIVIETRQSQVVCPQCHHRQQGRLPEGLEAGRHFGPRLEATVTYLQHQQHMSYARTQATLHDLFGVGLSEGGQACTPEASNVRGRPPRSKPRPFTSKSSESGRRQRRNRGPGGRTDLVAMGLCEFHGHLPRDPVEPGERRGGRGVWGAADSHLGV